MVPFSQREFPGVAQPAAESLNRIATPKPGADGANVTISSWLLQLLVVMAGGALGAAVRFLVSVGLARDEFPWGTLVVNLVGSFLIGILFVASQKEMPQLWKLAIGVGFLGALTTFSTFGLDTLLLWRRGQIALAVSYSLGSLILGVALVAAGLAVGQQWLGPVGK